MKLSRAEVLSKMEEHQLIQHARRAIEDLLTTDTSVHKDVGIYNAVYDDLLIKEKMLYQMCWEALEVLSPS